MLEVTGDLWTYWDNGGVVMIPTNGSTNKLGHMVMGKGLAGQAKFRFPGIARDWGNALREHGNQSIYDRQRRLASFPTKGHWFHDSSLTLINQVALSIMTFDPGRTIYLPRVGCGCGKLKWAQVRPLLVGLPDRFVVVHNGRDQG